MLVQPLLLFTGCTSIQFFSPYFLTQRVRPSLITYPSLCSACVTNRTSYHAIGHEALPIQPLPREAKDFPRSNKHFKHVPPLTYLTCFSLKSTYIGGLFICLALFKRYKRLLSGLELACQILYVFSSSSRYPFGHRD